MLKNFHKTVFYQKSLVILNFLKDCTFSNKSTVPKYIIFTLCGGTLPKKINTLQYLK